QSADAALRKALDDIDGIKKKLGANFSEVGDESNPTTVIGDMALHIAMYGPGVAQPTYNETIAKMSEALKNTTRDRDALNDRLQTELATFKQESDKLNAQLNAEKTARQLADTGKVKADNTHSEELKQKTNDIDELRRDLNQTRQEYDQYRESSEGNIKKLNDRI